MDRPELAAAHLLGRVEIHPRLPLRHEGEHGGAGCAPTGASSRSAERRWPIVSVRRARASSSRSEANFLRAVGSMGMRYP